MSITYTPLFCSYFIRLHESHRHQWPSAIKRKCQAAPMQGTM